MSYILDLIVVLIGVLCIWRGWSRGLVHTAVVLAGIVLAALLADKLAPTVAGWAYDTAAAPRIENALVERVTAAGDLKTQVDLTGLLGNREVLGKYLTDHGMPTTLTIGVPDMSEDSVRQTVVPLVESTVRPAAMLLLTAVTKVALVLAFLILVILLAKVIDGVFKLPVLKQINQAGGVLLGAVHGIFWILIFAAGVQLALHYGWFGDSLTAEAVEKTWLLSRVTGFNWIF